MTPLLCISHLRWDFVWQRPQHLLTRLAKHYQVYFVEEPITIPGLKEPVLETFPAQGAPHITIVRLRQPADSPYWIGHGDPRTQATCERLLLAWMREQHIEDPVLWLYTPMAAPFVDALPHRTFVFDAMDQLSAFAGAPPELIAQEQRLLPRADIIFTGGVSLYHAKQPFNPNTHLFPSGVEVEHFAPASNRVTIPHPAELTAIEPPILGFFGVIDERMDMALIGQVAQARPDWQIVMIGPVVKIDPARLPQHPNLHYLGGRTYQELPRYLAYFDVALLPFALNEATRFISPTKTLEYMAAHKPIVSTPVRDVIELYGEVVYVADTPAAFIRQVERALVADPQARRAAEHRLLDKHTWDNIAAEMQHLLQGLETRSQAMRPAMSKIAAAQPVTPLS